MRISATRKQRYLLCGFAFLLCFLLVIPVALHDNLPSAPQTPILNMKSASYSKSAYHPWAAIKTILILQLSVLSTLLPVLVSFLNSSEQFRNRASIPILFKSLILSPIKFTSITFNKAMTQHL
ncbi:hypothetical protein J2TS4_11660 [Paenibacillus sp. J2TS4]|nr:hypothetical protein J2TS4_11660 [Paenibacillus sp. J2TS4]